MHSKKKLIDFFSSADYVINDLLGLRRYRKVIWFGPKEEKKRSCNATPLPSTEPSLVAE